MTGVPTMSAYRSSTPVVLGYNGYRVPTGALVLTSRSIACGLAAAFAVLSLRAWLRNLSPPIKRCRSSYRPFTSATNAWTASLWTTFAGNPTRAQRANCSTAAANFLVTPRSAGSEHCVETGRPPPAGGLRKGPPEIRRCLRIPLRVGHCGRCLPTRLSRTWIHQTSVVSPCLCWPCVPAAPGILFGLLLLPATSRTSNVWLPGLVDSFLCLVV
jgi:hypothetical protein